MGRVARVSFLAVSGLCLLGVSAMAQEARAKRPKMANEFTVWTPDELKWVDNPDVKGGRVAVLWGDPKTGAYGALQTWPGGTEVPLHWHTFNSRGVVVSGTMHINSAKGMDRDVPAGSYFNVPGRMKHASGCRAGAECTFFVEQPGKGDIHMAEGGATKK